MQKQHISPIVLTILDGWGYSENIKGNAIKLASTPIIDYIWDKYPHTLLSASGEDVGLPAGQMGNSEVGHTIIGAGRTINQDLVTISKSIRSKKFLKNTIIHNICKNTSSQKSKLHIIGLCSNGGVHSHINHLIALLNIIKTYNIQICLHLITDGRDTQNYSAPKFIQNIIEVITIHSHIKICTISGRYYSMDRDSRWSRTEKTYNTLTGNRINFTLDPITLINSYYKQGISDEFIPPTRISKGSINSDDGIIFFNFRPDRMRQLLHAFTKKTFKGFQIKDLTNLQIITFTQYDANIKVPIIFPREKNINFLGEIISNYGLKQLRLAETEKYAHVTYFFNGGIEEPFPGEDRELIQSPLVDTYDLAPHMSADKLTDSIINAINQNIYKFIVINYANPDMVGHTGKIEPTIEAIVTVDKCIKKLLRVVQQVQGTLIITADHGNAEYMINSEDKPCKSHSTNSVPFMLISNTNQTRDKLRQNGSLSDIAPTILNLLNLPVPQEMNGKSLIMQSTINSLTNNA